MMQRRRALMAQAASPAPGELYSIGTDIKETYAPYPGVWAGSSAIDTTTGEIVSGSNYVNPNYIPISPDYTYEKNNQRMQDSAWYDANYVFISSFREYNTQVKDLPTAPPNARWLRIASNSGAGAGGLTITRTA